MKIFSTIIFLFIFSITLFSQDYYTDRILVCLDKNISNVSISIEDGIAQTGFSQLDELLAEYQVTKMTKWLTSAREEDIDGDIKLANVYAVYFSAPNRTVENALNSFQDCPMVFLAEYEPINHPDIFIAPHDPNDPLIGSQWHIERIEARWAWGLWTIFGQTPGNESIVLGDVDSGVEWWHSDLQANIWVNPAEDIDGDGVVGDFGPTSSGGDEDGIDNDGNGKIDDLIGWDFVGSNHNSPTQDNDPGAYPNTIGHGTNVGGCLSAATNNNNGVAGPGYRVKILGTKHGSEDGYDFILNGYDGLLYAARSGADVINCSWGSETYSAVAQSVISTAYNVYGAIVVAAAGNDGANLGSFNQYPAEYNNVICVAGTNSNDTKAGGSNYGTGVDISSPYSGIYTTDLNNSYDNPSGTSFSSPIVVGSLGLLKSYFPNESNSWLENRLYESADNIDDQNPGYIGLLGAGRVNVFKAIGQELFPSLIFNSQAMSIINDDGDGKLNPGEGAVLRVGLKNEQYWKDIDSLWAVLRSSEPEINITDSVAYYGAVNNGSIVINITDPFEFQTNPNIASGDYTFDLYLKAAIGETYYYEEILPITISISIDQNGFPLENLSYIQSSPAILDPNNGGALKIFTGSNGGDFYGFEATGSTIPNFPVALGGLMWGSLAAGDVDNDGDVEMVIGTTLSHLFIINRQGNIELDKALTSEAIYGTPSLKDIDNNNDLEIIFGTYGGNLYVMNHDGTVWPNFPVSLGTSERVIGGCAVGDLSGNGQPEFAFGTQANHVYAVDVSGNILSGFPFSTDERIQGSPLLVDLDGGGGLGTAIIAAAYSGKVYAIDSNGSQRWVYNTSGQLRGTPGLCDIDGNGTVEVFVGNNNGNIYGINYDGSALSGFPKLLGENIESAPVFADLDGNGTPELIVSTMSGYIHVYDFGQGSWLAGFPIQIGPQSKSTPQIIDLDNDGDLEIVVGTSNSLAALDFKIQGGTTEGYWNMFQGNLHRTGYYADIATGITPGTGNQIVYDFDLQQNYPNPFNPETNIDFSIPAKGQVELAVYNILGQQIKTLLSGSRASGKYSVTWDGTNNQGVGASSGIYFVRLNYLENSGKVEVKTIKLLLTK